MSMSIVKDKAPNQLVTFVFSQDQDSSISLQERYEIDKCVDWIKSNNYSKVCLQFPESYLSDSVEVALLIEERVSEKNYILGDTSYGSCCVDEVGAAHVNGDAVIHFGHACLTQNLTLPVLYVLPKRLLDLALLRDQLPPTLNGSVLVVYDVGYTHIADEIRECFPQDVVMGELLGIRDGNGKECSSHCSDGKTGKHTSVRFSRGFCLKTKAPDNLIYLGAETDPLFTNFAYLFKESQVWVFSGKSFHQPRTLKLLKQLSYYTEEVKAAGSLTIVVVSLAIPRFLDAIDYIKALAKRWKKKVYVVSIAKPNIAKLTNFPEMEVFVVVGCPETHLINNKEIIQPVVSLMEVELALNENRTWDSPFSKDFKDILPGGEDYIPFPEEAPEGAGQVSSITGRLSGQTVDADTNSNQLAINADKSVASSSAKTGGRRDKTWFGLEQSLGETPVTLATPGRTGTSTGYQDEPQRTTADTHL